MATLYSAQEAAILSDRNKARTAADKWEKTLQSINNMIQCGFKETYIEYLDTEHITKLEEEGYRVTLSNSSKQEYHITW